MKSIVTDIRTIEGFGYCLVLAGQYAFYAFVLYAWSLVTQHWLGKRKKTALTAGLEEQG